MKVLLINPPFFRFLGLEQDYVPLSLMAVGSKMMQDGHDVRIKNMEIGQGLSYKGYSERSKGFNSYLAGLVDDQNAIWNELRQTIETEQPDKIGVTVINVKHRSFEVVNKIAKEYKIPVMVGGPHTSIEPHVYPDEVEINAGEYESLGGRLIDLSKLPPSRWDMLLDQYSPDAYGHIMTSRGCPFSCRFCSSGAIWNRKVTYMPADRILRDMTFVEHLFHPNSFTIWDEVFTLNKKRLREFCSGYGKTVTTKWRCDTRADILDDATVDMMVDAGCAQMSIGVESGVDSILTYIGKGETAQDYRRAANILNRKNVQWKAYCIIGFPEESAEDMWETLDFVKSLGPFRITLSFFTPYKGTALYGECIERKLITADDSINDFFHQGPYNYFCPKLTREQYHQTRIDISKEIDEYNKRALLIWR